MDRKEKLENLKKKISEAIDVKHKIDNVPLSAKKEYIEGILEEKEAELESKKIDILKKKEAKFDDAMLSSKQHIENEEIHLNFAEKEKTLSHLDNYHIEEKQVGDMTSAINLNTSHRTNVDIHFDNKEQKEEVLDLLNMDFTQIITTGGGAGTANNQLDHSLLNNLTWSTAGHTIDTTIEMNDNSITGIDSLVFEEGNVSISSWAGGGIIEGNWNGGLTAGLGQFAYVTADDIQVTGGGDCYVTGAIRCADFESIIGTPWGTVDNNATSFDFLTDIDMGTNDILMGSASRITMSPSNTYIESGTGFGSHFGGLWVFDDNVTFDGTVQVSVGNNFTVYGDGYIFAKNIRTNNLFSLLGHQWGEVNESTGDFTFKQDVEIQGDVVMMANLPTSDPLNAGQIWNNSGILTVSAG